MKYKRFSKKYVEYCPLQFLFLCKNSVLLFVFRFKRKKEKNVIYIQQEPKKLKSLFGNIMRGKGFFQSLICCSTQTDTYRSNTFILMLWRVFIYISFHLYHRHKTFFKNDNHILCNSRLIISLIT